MQDGIIKGTGNSRYLKSIADFLTQYPTYNDFAAALAAGTLPIDLNGINETGWDQLGTALNKANLLSDETAEALGLPNTAVPDEAISECIAIQYGTYLGTGTLIDQSNPIEINLSGKGFPLLVIMSRRDLDAPNYIDLPFYLPFNARGLWMSNNNTQIDLLEWSGDKISVYGTNYLNTAGYEYYYVAFCYNGYVHSIPEVKNGEWVIG